MHVLAGTKKQTGAHSIKYLKETIHRTNINNESIQSGKNTCMSKCTCPTIRSYTFVCEKSLNTRSIIPETSKSWSFGYLI
jgi:hypothetical protein